jgi:hypothetical protein
MVGLTTGWGVACRTGWGTVVCGEFSTSPGDIKKNDTPDYNDNEYDGRYHYIFPGMVNTGSFFPGGSWGNMGDFTVFD